MGSQLNNRVVGIGGWPTRPVQIDVPQLDQEPVFGNVEFYARVPAQDAFPALGVVIESVQVEDSVFVARLSSTYPNHARFERRVDGGAWTRVSGDSDVLPVGACRVEYRSVDSRDFTSPSAMLDVWLPRANGFIESGAVGGVRRDASYCR
jgi:hypothetical protein